MSCTSHLVPSLDMVDVVCHFRGVDCDVTEAESIPLGGGPTGKCHPGLTIELVAAMLCWAFMLDRKDSVPGAGTGTGFYHLSF